MKSKTITINVYSDNCGILIHKTLKNALNICAKSVKNGLKTNINVLINGNDKIASDIADTFCNKYSFVELHIASNLTVSEQRNLLIDKSTGEYTLFISGLCLYSDNFLVESYKNIKKLNTKMIFYPEFIVDFGDQDRITKFAESNIKKTNPLGVFNSNYFINDYLILTEHLKNNKYPLDMGTETIEEANWLWSCSMLEQGYDFQPIKGTIYFNRFNNKLCKEDCITKSNPNILFNPNFVKNSKTPMIESKSLLIDQKITKTSARLRGLTKKIIVKGIKKITKGGTSHTYEYLLNQYQLNREYVSQALSKMKNKDILDSNHKENSLIPQKLVNIGVHKNTIDEWSRINLVEPMIRPNYNLLTSISINKIDEVNESAVAYYNFCNKYSDINFSDIVLVPHIIKGGADLASINLINTLSNDLNRKVLVFSTMNTDSPWCNRIKNNNVTFIEFKNHILKLNDNNQYLFILKLIQNWNINNLIIINSFFGYEFVKNFGKEIKKTSKIYLHTYAFDMDEEGFMFNVIKNGVVELYPYVDKYITDSTNYKRQLEEINGFKSSKIDALHLPINEKIDFKKDNTIKHKVLWASRISSAKLVEVAVEIGKRLKSHNIELHFYGALDYEYSLNRTFKKMILNEENIYYHGSYDGFNSIDTNNYDLYLLTSKNEGLPNIILEAAMANIFIVAPNVGGVSEVIKDGINGLIVNNNFIADEYLEKILMFYKDKFLQDPKRREAFNKTIINRHSYKEYIKRVKKAYID